MNIPAKHRKDSQGICFLGTIPFKEFVRHYVADAPGEIINQDTAEVIGRHSGVHLYTIGQRYGLNLSGGPWYVTKKDSLNKKLFVAHGYTSKTVGTDSFYVRDPHWISGHEPNEQTLDVKIRHAFRVYKECLVESESNGIYKVTLPETDFGVTPGQFAVFYKSEYCLGGGVIIE
jgi:tRNA-specific 2-thiouridylase